MTSYAKPKAPPKPQEATYRLPSPLKIGREDVVTSQGFNKGPTAQTKAFREKVAAFREKIKAQPPRPGFLTPEQKAKVEAYGQKIKATIKAKLPAKPGIPKGERVAALKAKVKAKLPTRHPQA